jgi:hypothetical protein
VAPPGARPAGQLGVEVDERRARNVTPQVLLASRRTTKCPANVEQRRGISLELVDESFD